MTLAGSIRSSLSTNWALTGNLAKGSIVFAQKSWYDYEAASQPQITVSPLVETVGGYYSNTNGSFSTQNYAQFVVNCWLAIPRGAVGTAEAQMIEDMRFEVCRIILAERNSIADFKPIVPTDYGVPLHENENQPRILRYEITLLGAHEKNS